MKVSVIVTVHVVTPVSTFESPLSTGPALYFLVFGPSLPPLFSFLVPSLTPHGSVLFLVLFCIIKLLCPGSTAGSGSILSPWTWKNTKLCNRPGSLPPWIPLRGSIFPADGLPHVRRPEMFRGTSEAPPEAAALPWQIRNRLNHVLFPGSDPQKVERIWENLLEFYQLLSRGVFFHCFSLLDLDKNFFKVCFPKPEWMDGWMDVFLQTFLTTVEM